MTTFGEVARRGGAWLPVLAVADLAGTATSLALPTALGRVVDGVVSGEDATLRIAVVAALVAVAVVTELVSTFAEPACVARTTAWLRVRLVRHVFAIGPRGVRGFDTGDLVTRVSGNASDAARAGATAVTVGTSLLPPIGSLVALAWLDVWLAVAFLAGVALVGLILRGFARGTAQVASAYQQIQGRIAARLAESLAGARTIAAAGTAYREERRVLEPLAALHEEGWATWRLLSRAGAQAAVVGPLVLVAVLAAGGYQLVHGRLTPGELFAASQYAVLGAGLGGLTGVLGTLARARSAVRRAAEVLAVDPVRHGTGALPAGPGLLEFRGVTVREDGAAVLDHVDVTIPGGAAAAVVGPSGAGKSVLAALAARLRDPDEGLVLLDDVPLRELRHDVLRTAVGCAFERPVLVGETVADAVGLGLDHAAIEAAARATHAHEFVSRLPEGYDTPLASAPMSGGERQRLGLAGAWRAERLLVLDDATSSLDMVTEMQIARTLTDDHGTRTRLIVTHRLATAARADLVVWLDGGRVLGVGTHERLWERPAYREVFG
ncbi:MAG TPA: ABC transporter ATP-binding protein [Mycobacteriales bacterium]